MEHGVPGEELSGDFLVLHSDVSFFFSPALLNVPIWMLIPLSHFPPSGSRLECWECLWFNEA